MTADFCLRVWQHFMYVDYFWETKRQRKVGSDIRFCWCRYKICTAVDVKFKVISKSGTRRLIETVRVWRKPKTFIENIFSESKLNTHTYRARTKFADIQNATRHKQPLRCSLAAHCTQIQLYIVHCTLKRENNMLYFIYLFIWHYIITQLYVFLSYLYLMEGIIYINPAFVFIFIQWCDHIKDGFVSILKTKMSL